MVNGRRRLDVGEIWRERYEPLDVVGEGGEGYVVRAVDRLHGRLVALKVRRRGSPDEEQALLTEARMLFGLRPHPSVTIAREDFFLDDRYVLVMDWIDGTSLADRLAEAGRPGLPFDDVVGWLEQVADALGHLHGQRPPVIHGDVKPSNIVVTADGTAVLVDFGIARRHDRSPRSLHGSRQYMAPELASDGQATPAADVFSLAATAFTLLTGQAPAPGVAPDWRGIAGERAAEVETALRRGLAIDPLRRPGSAAELVQALRGATVPPNNLPVDLTSFVGRKDEIRRIRAQLPAARLLTLVGTGGVGKTRLALQVAREALPVYPDGVFVTELAPLADGALVAQQVLMSLGVSSEDDHDDREATATAHASITSAAPLARLLAYLGRQRMLLVLDNCEHVVNACASVVGAIVRTCPDVRVLATSREPLGVPGEAVWLVEPLPVTNPAPLVSDGDAENAAAISLFVDRAASASPGFHLTDLNADTVVEVCSRLEGIPLAIELAAAWARLLPVEEILRRLDDRLRLLAGGSATAPERHRSLRAALDWTYEALSRRGQALFRRLSVFSGGFTFEAAETVCATPPVEQDDVLDVLAGLMAKSLVVRDDSAATRYRMLETVRQYAAEALETAGEAALAAQRHLVWAQALADEAMPRATEGTAEQVLALEREHDNLRAALSHAATEPSGDALVQLTAAMAWFWQRRGYLEEGRRWTEAALTHTPDRRNDLQTTVLIAAGRLAVAQGDFPAARHHFEEAATLAEEIGDDEAVIEAREGLADVAPRFADLQVGRLLHEENLAVRRRKGDRRGIAESLLRLIPFEPETGRPRGELASEAVAILRDLDEPATFARALRVWAQTLLSEDPATSRAAYHEALVIHDRVGDRLGTADTLARLANLEQVSGNFEEAYLLFQQVLAIRREMGNRGQLALALLQMGQLVQYQGDYDGARPYFEQAVAVAQEIGDDHAEANALDALALLLMFQSDYATAKPLLERALRMLRDRGDPFCEQKVLMSLGDAAWGVGDATGAMALYREAVLANPGAAAGNAAFLFERLGSPRAQGDVARATKLLAGAQALRDALGIVRPPYGVPEWEENLALARRQLGEERFAAAWADGYTMPLNDLIRYAAEQPQTALDGDASVRPDADRRRCPPAREGAHGGVRPAAEEAQ
jgi:non-specific serine/threonine protein kinase